MSRFCQQEGCSKRPARNGSWCAAHHPDRELRAQLPMEPLVVLVDAHGGLAACGVPTASALARNYYQAKKRGTVTPARADMFAHGVLRCHPCEVWPTWFGPYGLTV